MISIMKKMAAALLFLAIISCQSFGMGSAIPSKESTNYKSLRIGSFENQKSKNNSKWWTFGDISLKITGEEKQSLELSGSTKNWYVGGVGTSIGNDAGKYSAFDIEVYGTGKDSGTLKIELYDDDNGNNVIESNPKNGYAPIFDDRFVYLLKVDWDGLKHVSIPLPDFVDDNPEAGDNIWNPHQVNGSFGLIQMQIIIMARTKVGKIDLAISNLKLKESENNEK